MSDFTVHKILVYVYMDIAGIVPICAHDDGL